MATTSSYGASSTRSTSAAPGSAAAITAVRAPDRGSRSGHVISLPPPLERRAGPVQPRLHGAGSHVEQGGGSASVTPSRSRSTRMTRCSGRARRSVARDVDDVVAVRAQRRGERRRRGARVTGRRLATRTPRGRRCGGPSPRRRPAPAATRGCGDGDEGLLHGVVPFVEGDGPADPPDAGRELADERVDGEAVAPLRPAARRPPRPKRTGTSKGSRPLVRSRRRAEVGSMDDVTVVGAGWPGWSPASRAPRRGAPVRLHEAHAHLGGRARSTAGDTRPTTGPTSSTRTDRVDVARRARLPAAVSPTRPSRASGSGMTASSCATPPRGARAARCSSARADGTGRRVLPRLGDRACGRRRRRGCWRRPPASSPSTPTPAACRLPSCGSGSSACTSLPPRPATSSAAGRPGRPARRPCPPTRRGDRDGHRVDALPDAPGDRGDGARRGPPPARRRDAALGRAPAPRCSTSACGTRRGDPFIVSDLDESGWVENVLDARPVPRPRRPHLLQAQVGHAPGESARRRRSPASRPSSTSATPAGANGRRGAAGPSSTAGRGALDLPGTTWRDRPAIDRGNGVFLAGDMVAAPGLLGEVSVNSALQAAQLAVAYAGSTTTAARARPVGLRS